jgi:DNA-binding IclR family transcriptional regulator
MDTAEKEPERGSTGVQAAEVVLRILDSFVSTEPRLMLKTIAERAGLHPAKVHRYLHSLRQCGLVAREPETGLYYLADGAVELGFAALEAIDPVVVARPFLLALQEATGYSTILSRWSGNSPVVVLQELRSEPLMLVTRVGSPLPLLTTASGLTFLAWLPAYIAESALDALRRSGGSPEERQLLRAPARLAALLQRIRAEGIATSEGQMNLNVHGLSAPIFDGEGAIAAVVSVMGLRGRIDLDLEGPVAARLRACAREVTQELGGT